MSMHKTSKERKPLPTRLAGSGMKSTCNNFKYNFNFLVVRNDNNDQNL
jgi:hypothetical protein